MFIEMIELADGSLYPLHDIVSVRMHAERCTGDTEDDYLNTWYVSITTRDDRTLTVYEAPGFDNKEDIFYSQDAVKGNNYALAKHIETMLNILLEKQAKNIVRI